MSIGLRIKEKRIEQDMTLEDLASKLKTSRQTLSRYETGIISNIPSDKIEAIAQVLKTSPSYLMGWSDPKEEYLRFDNIYPIETRKFPLLGEVACGEPKLADECFEGYIEIGTDIDADFCLKAKGDSMINARIHDGDVVFVRKQSIVNNGEIGVIIIDNEATLKRIYIQDGVISLVAENPKYQPIVYTGEKLNDVRIIGKAIAFQSDIK